ncbi:hypothetical protein TRFO_31872 [Tritrichomonas foetus]|uniref:TLC domain-containing protein n=1 Tax=Tritrichomonas foetus TaxID=1144522 RepID=A0A1J4JQH8_9EUKA|nr:hypothetical protein TRFO_31872 [Tritrichomonas foetus]|eukprot:OHT01299.1 hypothetical protein TRFO_31872 [Tritrichomonas foetus]
MTNSLKFTFHDIIDAVTEGNTLNKCLTAALFISYAYTFSCITRETLACCEFFAFLVVVYFMNKAIADFFEKSARWLAENVFVGKSNENILERKFKLGRFKSQGLQFSTHFLSVLLQIPTIIPEGLMSDFDKLWSPCPVVQEITHAIRFAYMFELASYCFQAFEHRFSNIRNKDYYVMFTHHIVTILLIAGSYDANAFRVGLLVMFMHDFSDIFVDINLMTNQLGMEGKDYFFLSEILYIFMSSSWFIFRLIYLPKLIKNILTSGHRMCAAQFPGQVWKYPHCEGIKFFWPGVIMLSALVVMHAYWMYLIFMIGYRVITDTTSTNKAEAYETDLNEVKKRKLEKKEKAKNE